MVLANLEPNYSARPVMTCTASRLPDVGDSRNYAARN